MNLTAYPDAAAFLEDTQDFLEEEEAANNLILGLALACRENSAAVPEVRTFAITQAGGVVFAALQTPPRNLILYGIPRQAPQAARMMYDHLSSNGLSIPGVIGPEAFTTRFIENWPAKDGWRRKMEMGVFRLDELQAVRPASGSLRLATDDDLDLLTEWITAFNQEVFCNYDPEGGRALAISITRQKKFFIWEDGQAVSMTAVGRPTPHGITVYYVYTPPELRGHGYASNCVAEVSATMLNRGYRFCTLFTDLQNPTSNKIYQQMGYRRISTFLEFSGDEGHEGA